MVFSVIVFIGTVLICFKFPYKGLILLLNINIIRNLQSITIQNPCLKCISDPDIVLGGVLQVLGLIIVFVRGTSTKSPTYKLDFVDMFLGLTFFLLIISSGISDSPSEAFLYTTKYLLLGIPYFFVTKALFINSKDFKENLTKMLVFAVNLSVIFGIIAALIVIISGYEEPYAKYGVVMRLTIQGVHPIPFAQAVGFGLLSALFLIVNKIKSKKSILQLLVKAAFLTIILLFTNTRGVVVSLVLSLILAAGFYLKSPKINKKTATIFLISVLCFFTGVILFIDIKSLFGRFYFDPYAFESTFLRLDSLFESFKIFRQKLFTGIGPTGFPTYSVLPYPHNFILEYIVFFGIWGAILMGLFTIFILELYLVTLKNKKDVFYVFLFITFLFYFIETQVSFTLWTHKGVYFSLGLLMAYYTINKRCVK
jgi:O-antigen ligase